MAKTMRAASKVLKRFMSILLEQLQCEHEICAISLSMAIDGCQHFESCNRACRIQKITFRQMQIILQCA